MEEPEFWNRGGYSEGFKREWKEYYDESWQAQHESPEAAYRSAKLKYHLYFRALEQVFLFAKEYSEKKGRRVRCYVPTHTLINYSAWEIVSPESSLADLAGMDGYIGQVWTGTARTPVIYEGIEKERTFENAFLEYGSMVAMTKPAGRRVYFLTDPIEDNPNHTWEDYKNNYEATFTAQLMYPSVSHYEVMPWPSRIFLGKYRVEGSDKREPIPTKYATEILTLINALNEMRSSNNQIPGTQGVGVLLSDTMMFQRFPTFGEEYTDRRHSNFYGLALPLLKHGVPVQLVQMENLLHPETLRDIRVLLMSYAHMKPMKPEYHKVLADWVKNGGALVYVGRDNDPYQTIREWWNQGKNHYKAPSEHLFEQLGAEPKSKTLTIKEGKGILSILRKNPKEIATAKGGGDELRALIKTCLCEIGYENEWKKQNVLHLQRGPYDIAAVLEESVSDTPYTIPGPVIDLYNPDLLVLDKKVIEPGERAFLLSLSRFTKESPCILAAASRVSDRKKEGATYTFTLKGPANTQGIARILLKSKPEKLTIQSSAETPMEPEWDETTKTMLIRYPNSPDGVQVIVED